MNKKLASVKNHITRNRAKYAVAVTLVACYAVSRKAVGEWNTFLTEKNLLDEYYTPED